MQLADRTLAPDIVARLPDACGDWPLIEANDLLKGYLYTEAIPTATPGLPLHYDIVLFTATGSSTATKTTLRSSCWPRRNLCMSFL